MTTELFAVSPLDISAATCGTLSVALLVCVAVGQNRRRAARSRLAAFASNSVVEATDPAAPRTARGLVNSLSFVQRLLPERWYQALRRQAARAGNPGGLSPEGLLCLRVGSVLVSLFVAAAFGSVASRYPLGVFGAIVVLLLGLLSTDLYLVSRTSARVRAAEAELPTLVDLLSLSIAAGMAFDTALRLILARMRGPLAEELGQYLKEVSELGVAREDALRGVSERLGDAPDIHAFTEAIQRATALGTGLLAVVGAQASLLRQERRLRATAAAQRAPVRMLIPMTLFMLPVLMMIVIGPVALRLMASSQGV